MMGRPPAFKIQLVGLTKEISQRNGLFTIIPDCIITDIKKTDLIIVPAMHGNRQPAGGY